MKKLCELFIAFAVVWTLAANAADTGPVREFYACNFQDGKDMDDSSIATMASSVNS